MEGGEQKEEKEKERRKQKKFGKERGERWEGITRDGEVEKEERGGEILIKASFQTSQNHHINCS